MTKKKKLPSYYAISCKQGERQRVLYIKALLFVESRGSPIFTGERCRSQLLIFLSFEPVRLLCNACLDLQIPTESVYFGRLLLLTAQLNGRNH